MAATALACPVCGDPAQTLPIARIVRCTACSAALYVENPPTPHVMVDAKLDAAHALAATKSWMHGVRHRELLAWRARLDTPRLVYLPFARIEATVLGTLYGTRKHEEDNRTYYTDEEVEVAEQHETITPLSTAGELDVERLPDDATADAKPFDEATIAARGGELVPALESSTTVTERAHTTYLERAHIGHDLATITGEALTVVGARETIIHYPFWRIDYRVGRNAYTAVVDARSGEIAYGRAPGSTLFHTGFYGLVMPIAALVMLVAVIIAAKVLAVASEVSNVSEKVGGAIFIAGAAIGGCGIAAGGFLALVAHRGLRAAGEVESGYGAHAGAALFDIDDEAYLASRASEQDEVAQDKALAAYETER